MRTLIIILTCIVGCATAPVLRAPTGFVQVAGDPYDVRLTSAEGVVLGVRVLPNEPRGDLGFWAGAIDARLRAHYVLVEREEVETTHGQRGVRLRYTHTRDSRPHHYWSTVFVDERHVYLVEAGGDEEFFTPRAREIEAAIGSLELEL